LEGVFSINKKKGAPRGSWKDAEAVEGGGALEDVEVGEEDEEKE
jgi:hypothetical protein